MFFRHHRRLLFTAYGTTLGAAVAGLTIPRVLGIGIDRVLDPANESRGP